MQNIDDYLNFAEEMKVKSRDMDIDLKNALEQGFSAVKQGRKILLDYFGHLTQVTEKYKAGLVSEADVASEKAIVNSLLGYFPHHKIIGEEQCADKINQSPVVIQSEFPTWIIDPLDGTTNYVYGFHVFCISVGLQFRGEMLVGIVDMPKLDQTYYATRGGGAFVREQGKDRRLRVSRRKSLRESLLATGFSPYEEDVLIEQMQIFSKLIRETRGIRRAGAAAYDLCQVAEGIFDGFWEKNLSPWDTAAGLLLVREAGGIVTNYAGQPYSVEMNSILASNPNIHSAMTSTLSLTN